MEHPTTAAPTLFLARLLWFFHLVLSLLFWSLTSRAEEPMTCFTESSETHIEIVSEHGDLHLASGLIVYLADLSLPDENPWQNQALEKLRRLSGVAIKVRYGRPKDRWQRHRAEIVVGENNLTLELVKTGLAIVDPKEADQLCNAHLRTSEQEARSNRVGLWSNPTNHPVEVRNTSELLQREGRFTLVTGRILTIGIRKNWVYLNFGRDWQNDFTATIPISIWRKLDSRQINEQKLKGKTVLLRGVLRHWKGPSMEITTPDSIEMFDEKTGLYQSN